MQKKENKMVEEVLQNNKKKILLHSCCAVCMAYPMELLKKEYEPIVFFFNPNIYPLTEHDRRRDELINYCKKMDYEYIIQEEDSSGWYKFIEGFEQEPEKGLRCNKCFEYRLAVTAQNAKDLEIDFISTTLSVSPHKVSKNIFSVGEEIQNKYGVSFLQMDFKKQNGFLKTMQIAKENDFYRQQYCGCEFSIRP